MEFFFFFLANAALFVRPGELSQSWESIPVYLMLIVIAMGFALNRRL